MLKKWEEVIYKSIFEIKKKNRIGSAAGRVARPRASALSRLPPWASSTLRLGSGGPRPAQLRAKGHGPRTVDTLSIFYQTTIYKELLSLIMNKTCYL